LGYYSKGIAAGSLQKLGIAHLEIYALYSAMVHFEPYIKGRTSYIFVDNEVVLAVLRYQKVIKKRTKLDNMSSKILNWFKDSKIFFCSLYRPRKAGRHMVLFSNY
jgi:hypothetical protein